MPSPRPTLHRTSQGGARRVRLASGYGPTRTQCTRAQSTLAGRGRIRRDQPVEAGGHAGAVAPFDLFLASLATCAGAYVLGFCRARGLSTEGIGLRQLAEVDPSTKLPSRICLELRLPASFPEKYRAAVLRAAEGCKVKKAIAAAPTIDVALVPAQPLLERAT